MFSINTNTGAMTALQMLGGTTRQLDNVQDDVATGREVDTAKDNAALWAISQMMDSDTAGYRGVSNALSLGEATAAVALAGAEQITDTLMDMKKLAISAASGLIDYSKVEAQMQQKAEQINSIISASQFNGINLLATDVDGNGATGISVAASLDRQGAGSTTLSTITVDSVNFEGDAAFDLGNRTPITDKASAMAALDEMEGFIQFAIDGAALLGASTEQMSNQSDFIGKLADVVKQGQSSMVDTNMEEAATKWHALQAQQQLGSLSLSIANAAPQALKALF
ncbi:flagellin [Cribrihabitans neustonicus]|uniref:flagellin N-terminal helical domain-containing protein n=1 Tax=Cribrihabitans neustonicus TaxID=1429085 RepID=UPI003B5BF043